MSGACERYLKARQATIERNKRKAERAARESATFRKRLSEDAPTRERNRQSTTTN